MSDERYYCSLKQIYCVYHDIHSGDNGNLQVCLPDGKTGKRFLIDDFNRCPFTSKQQEIKEQTFGERLLLNIGKKGIEDIADLHINHFIEIAEETLAESKEEWIEEFMDWYMLDMPPSATAMRQKLREIIK